MIMLEAQQNHTLHVLSADDEITSVPQEKRMMEDPINE